MNSSGINLIKKSEGLSFSPYLDSVKTPTIGYGNTFYPNGVPVKMSDKSITKLEAENLLNKIVLNFEREVKKVITLDLNENQFSACVSLAYNIGINAFKNSTLLKKINANAPLSEIETQFNRWIYAGGKILNGLVTRRKAEFSLYAKKTFSPIIVPLILLFYTVFIVTL